MGSGNQDKSDQAALFGAAFAAIVTLVLGEGPWGPLSVTFGFVLLSVVAAYYRPLPPTGWVDSLTKASAFAAVLALVGFLLLAYPIQELLVRPRYPSGIVSADRYEDHLGEITTSWGWLVWTVLFVIALASWYLWTRPRHRGRDDYRSMPSARMRRRQAIISDCPTAGTGSRSPDVPTGNGVKSPSAEAGCVRSEKPA